MDWKEKGEGAAQAQVMASGDLACPSFTQERSTSKTQSKARTRPSDPKRGRSHNTTLQLLPGELRDRTQSAQRSVEFVGDSGFSKLKGKKPSANRDEGDDVDKDLAGQDAKDLYDAGEGRWGTDELAFNEVLAKRSYKQLRATFQAYQIQSQAKQRSFPNCCIMQDYYSPWTSSPGRKNVKEEEPYTGAEHSDFRQTVIPTLSRATWKRTFGKTLWYSLAQIVCGPQELVEGSRGNPVEHFCGAAATQGSMLRKTKQRHLKEGQVEHNEDPGFQKTPREIASIRRACEGSMITLTTECLVPRTSIPAQN
ncbi:hypothetical protein P7K49_026746 [Saguinus oedipus]|uniref:Uncharacterized protein n=1 Tax=Saguinus oedipus TaxID=9490 RepID=A0ABQ9UE81_SAGOE|nr:hypothetical protein P7K49_026746 [Saguinus oedipus]